MDRVMNRIEGRDPDFQQDDPEGAARPSAQQVKTQAEIGRVRAMGAELKGIASSIDALIDLFNQKIDENLSGHDSVIKLSPNEYRSIFTSNTEKLDRLIEQEIEQRNVLSEQ